MSGFLSAYHYPNRMGRILLVALEEIVGSAGLEATLGLAGYSQFCRNYPANNQNLDFPFEAVAGLQGALEGLYGPRGGMGLALRAGRASFLYGLREFGPLLGLTDLAFRLMPLQTKLSVGAKSFAEIFNKYSDQRVSVLETSRTLVWTIERCPVCWGRSHSVPCCHLAVGLLQESLYWVSGGKLFEVEETACKARGDANCVIEIVKAPMG